jgi:demethylmenaquinone methyltransferase/2-methoxy-6-polyprenyl-1,4-benzoquinol methylase
MNEEIQGPSRAEIWKMFDQISPTYDRVNRVMTFGLDQIWRKKLCAFLPEKKQMCILDCATGTGDQIIALMEKRPDIAIVIGIDLAETMIELGKDKIAEKQYANQITFQVADALQIPYPDNHFDCVTISFGIRNVTDIMAAFKEFRRVLKPGGRVLILEGTIPRTKWLRSLHLFYLRHFLPRIGGLISKNFKAYRYLNKTIETFPQGEMLNGKMRAAGLIKVHSNLIFGGITTVYQGDKDAPIPN